MEHDRKHVKCNSPDKIGTCGLVTFNTLDEFVNIVKKCKTQKTTLLVCFSTTWCGPCKRIKPFLVKQADAYNDDDRICIAKTDNSDAEEFLTGLHTKFDIRITGFPFFALISSDDKIGTKTWSGANESIILKEMSTVL